MSASTSWTQPYWEAVSDQQLLYQECADCEAAVFPPRKLCPTCSSDNLSWRESDGKGAIYSVTVVVKGAVPEFEEQMPYAVGMVSMDEGFRIVTRFLTDDPDSLECDDRVRVIYERLGDGPLLPCFERDAS